jgi:D-alanyl-lipoteichoic acid acyltransferase DltB (MBOAT superfamily)
LLFNTALFGAFFFCFFIVFKFLARTRITKLWVITIASAIFYSAWDYRCLPLLFGTALVDFYIARAIDREQTDEKRRKRLLVSSIVLNLGVLSFFKYTNFAFDSVYGLISLFGHPIKAPVFNIILPIGISFYTFQSMSYTIDVYRKTLVARERPIEFLSAVSFFPHLVAGPIVRAATLLPQFEKFTPPQWQMIQRGALLIASGLFKKTIGDLLGNIVDPIFRGAGPDTSMLQGWTGALAFQGQIFCDFSGYTDIAIGVAAVLGFNLPPNFDLPFLASSPADYWRRWHISLSTWIRDYLFTPLSRTNRRHPYFNLVITMVVIGLWHGARWTYVVYGLYHGLLMAIWQWVSTVVPLPAKVEDSRWLRLAQTLFTFYLIAVSLVLFRATTLAQAGAMLRGMHFPKVASSWAEEATPMFVLTILGLVIPYLVTFLVERKKDSKVHPLILWPAVVILLALGIAFGDSHRAFIYFQF